MIWHALTPAALPNLYIFRWIYRKTGFLTNVISVWLVYGARIHIAVVAR